MKKSRFCINFEEKHLLGVLIIKDYLYESIIIETCDMRVRNRKYAGAVGRTVVASIIRNVIWTTVLINMKNKKLCKEMLLFLYIINYFICILAIFVIN